tara:strand:+ start:1278 stop:1493 length:216 start_codon:yes stop_codon:yes gene_type:complete
MEEIMKRNEVYNLLLNFAEGVEADTTAAKQVMGVGRAIRILDNNIREVITPQQKTKYDKLITKINEQYEGV